MPVVTSTSISPVELPAVNIRGVDYVPSESRTAQTTSSGPRLYVEREISFDSLEGNPTVFQQLFVKLSEGLTDAEIYLSSSEGRPFLTISGYRPISMEEAREAATLSGRL